MCSSIINAHPLSVSLSIHGPLGGGWGSNSQVMATFNHMGGSLSFYVPPPGIFK